MGLFKKIFKGIGKVFKSIGRGIKKVFRGFGKFVNKLGIVGQIGMFVLSMYAGPMLWSALSNSLTSGILAPIGQMASGAGKLISTAAKGARAMMAKSKIGRVVLEGAKRISNAATGVKRLTIDQLGSITKGTKDMLTTTLKAAGEKMGLEPALTSVTYTPTAATAASAVEGSAVVGTSSQAVIEAAGGAGYTETLKAIAKKVPDDMAANFWDAGDLFKGGSRTVDISVAAPSVDPLAKVKAKGDYFSDKTYYVDTEGAKYFGQPGYKPPSSLVSSTPDSILSAEQPAFKSIQSTAGATIKQGSQPIKEFAKTKFDLDTAMGTGFAGGIQTAVSTAAMDPPETVLPSTFGYRPNTRSLVADIFEQADIAKPIRAYSDFQISPNTFLANHSIANETSEYENAYNHWLLGAAQNQSVNYAQT